MSQVYFLAHAVEVAALSGQDPRRRLPPERVLDFDDAPTPDELSRLVAILRGNPSGIGPSVVSAVAESGPAGVARITDQAVLALQGADGDPEMEWEDVVALWHDSLSGSDGAVSDRTDDELLAIIEELRRLVGGVTHESDDGWKLYFCSV